MTGRKQPLLVICGPTASGKTGWALQVARYFPVEIISADSRQVYRRMDIGTAKATAAERAAVPHHMIDLVDPDDEFSVADFVAIARPLISQIIERGHFPCLVGGTGLYIRALLGGLAELPSADPQLREELHQQERAAGKGSLHRELQCIDPVSAAAIHPNNTVRIVRALEVYRLSGRTMAEFQAEHGFADQRYRVLKFAPLLDRSDLFQRIEKRAGQMLKDGLVDEVRGLLRHYSPQLKSLQTLGYREVLRHLDRPDGFVKMQEEISLYTRQYAKRQLTWFRKDPEIIWVDSSTESGRVLKSIEEFFCR
ncbi:MAG: tRNA (adenosine(37)-N6)-dimethylallyltransferase MiaA [Desulfuromonadales bacterium C00003093]|nr:MAG: tRNA (adenosine(37)-N6)-dimethylallyltransferase MiaA [Desulfuromonadales bacterium C00003093]